MVDFPYHQQSQSAQPSFHYCNDPHQQTLYTQVAKASTVLTVGGFLLVFVALMLIGTVISLTAVTPLFVNFSPILVPVVILIAILNLGFLVSGGFGVMAIVVLAWIYGYVTGKHPHGADQLDNARHILLNKA